MSAKISTNQMPLPGVEMAWCKCACGQSFMRVAKGRRREYLNKSHKKREARRLARLRRTEARVNLTPKGYLYLNAHNHDEIAALWAVMTPAEKALITLVCETGLSLETMREAAHGLLTEFVE